MAEQLEAHIVSEDMNFSKKLRAMGVGSKAHYQLSSSNTGSVTAGTGVKEFIITGQQRGKFLELKNAFVAVDITNGDVDPDSFQGIGSMGIIARRRITTSSGAIICDTANVNCLDAAMLNKHASESWMNKTGNALFGTSTNPIAGLSIANGATRRVLIPIHMVGIDEVLFPLFGVENIHIEISFEFAKTAYYATTTGVTDAQIVYTNAVLHYDTLQLSNDQYSDLVDMLGGKFNLTVPCWDRAGNVIPKDNTSHTLQIATSRRKAKRVIACQRNSTFLLDDKVNSFAMDRGNATEFSLLHAGVEIKNRAYPADNTTLGAEAFAASIASDGGNIMDTSVSGLCTNAALVLEDTAAGNTQATSGCFFMDFDLQSGFEVEGASISGINAVAGSLMLNLTRTATGADRNLDVFTEYWADLELDMNTDMTWSVKT